jgi:hypothetical protein
MRAAPTSRFRATRLLQPPCRVGQNDSCLQARDKLRALARIKDRLPAIFETVFPHGPLAVSVNRGQAALFQLQHD